MNGRPWTPKDAAELKRLYPNMQTAKIAESMGRPITSVYSKAGTLGLKKSKEYLASPDACRLRRGDDVGAPHRFKKGHVPANKGLRRPGWYAGRMRETQFKKGNKPQTWKPIGSERIADGYLQRKVTDTGYTPRDWKPVHVLLWIEHYGPIPKGYVVAFIDGDKTHIELNNLVLLHRRDLMRRNTIHNYPDEIKQVIRLSGKLKRTIERAENEKQDSRLA